MEVSRSASKTNQSEIPRGVYPECPPACRRVHSAGNFASGAELLHTPLGPGSAAMVVDRLVPLCPSLSLTSVVAVRCLVARGS